MKVTLKLNCKSVWPTCWRTIKIQSRRDFISAADKMNGDISPLGDLWFFTVVGTRRQCVCSYSVWLSFLPLSRSRSLCLQCLSKNINKTPWRESQQDASQGGGTRGEGERRREAERKGRGYVIYQSWSIRDMEVLNERSFIYRLVLNLVLLPLSLQVLDV